jgi:hypothetical protein
MRSAALWAASPRLRKFPLKKLFSKFYADWDEGWATGTVQCLRHFVPFGFSTVLVTL